MTKCIRSGACCVSFEVHGVPGYESGIKPSNEVCLHLVSAYKDEQNRWHHAKCLLHDTSDFPLECRNFNFPGSNNICGLGEAVWKTRGVFQFEIDLSD